jgi:hypothetical protein
MQRKSNIEYNEDILFWVNLRRKDICYTLIF